jgi:hypothetical protein
LSCLYLIGSFFLSSYIPSSSPSYFHPLRRHSSLVLPPEGTGSTPLQAVDPSSAAVRMFLVCSLADDN